MNNAIAKVELSEKLPFGAIPHDAEHLQFAEKADGSIVAGYLAHDTCPNNPLEDCEGSGSVLSRLSWDRTVQGQIQEALGLDGYGDPNLELVDDHPATWKKMWVTAAAAHVEFQVWANDTAGPRASFLQAYYQRRAAQLWELSVNGSYGSTDTTIDDFAFTEEAKLRCWETLRDDGLIGDRDAVLLDVYRHGGEVWSLSGEGHSCRWDTSRGAGVWIPDLYAREEIDRRAPIYAFGRVVNAGRFTRDDRKYHAILDEAYGVEHSPRFEYWHEAFEWMQQRVAKLSPRGRKAEREMAQLRGRQRAAEEIARSAVQEYNAWLSGDCWGVVVITFKLVDGKYEEANHDAVWGFVGREIAENELKASFEFAVEQD